MGSSRYLALPPFTDTDALVMGSADPTKKVRLEVDGLTTGQTRVLTPPDQDGTVGVLEKVQTWTVGPQVFVGGVTVRQSGGVAGTDEIRITHDGSNGLIDSRDGEMRLAASGTVRLRVDTNNVYLANGIPDVTLSRDLGNSVLQWRDCFVRRLVMDEATAAVRMTDVQLKRAGTNCFVITDVAGSTGGQLEFLQSADVGTPSTNSARIGAEDVAGTAELVVCGEDGTETQISPHAPDAPDWLYDGSPQDPVNDEVHRSLQPVLDRVEFVNLTRLARLVDGILDGKIEDLKRLPKPQRTTFHSENVTGYATRTGRNKRKKTWKEMQDQNQQAYDVLRQAEVDIRDKWDEARATEVKAAAEWDSLPEEEREGLRPEVRPQNDRPTVRPPANVRKPMPQRLRRRGAKE